MLLLLRCLLRKAKLPRPLDKSTSSTRHCNHGSRNSARCDACCAHSLAHRVRRSRPKTIDDVSAQEHTVSVLRKALTSSNVHAIVYNGVQSLLMTLLKLPHMLFYGPPGTGKTSTILALARQLYGCHYICVVLICY